MSQSKKPDESAPSSAGSIRLFIIGPVALFAVLTTAAVSIA
jgi:hypothetical protein